MSRFLVLFLAALLLLPNFVFAAAAPSMEELQLQIADIMEELDDLSDRLEGPERHTATDRISFTGDFRNTVDSLHYKDVAYNPGIKVKLPPMPPGTPGFPNGFPGGVVTMPFAPEPREYDIDNDAMFTTRLRLTMKADVASNMNFVGRLNMYKNWGDSTSTKVLDSWDAFSMDGASSGKTSGDYVRVDRAFFNWKDIGGSEFYLSIGRRPSTYG
ncbi:MAG: DUF3373 domain-containing protein, partial [Deltaproteobacteria bacterium]